MACAPGATMVAISARCSATASVVQRGSTRPAPFARGGTDGAKDVGRRGPLIVRGRRPGAPLGLAAGDLGLLTDPGLVLEPELYRLAAGLLLEGCHDSREVFLKRSWAAASLAWWRGRADSLRYSPQPFQRGYATLEPWAAPPMARSSRLRICLVTEMP